MKTLFILASLISSIALAKNENVSSGGGRFQLIQLSDMRRDQYLIDTQTGKIWTKVCSIPSDNGTDCEMLSWQQETVIGLTTSEDAYYKRVREVKKLLEEEKSAKAGK